MSLCTLADSQLTNLIGYSRNIFKNEDLSKEQFRETLPHNISYRVAPYEIVSAIINQESFLSFFWLNAQ